MIVVWLEKKGSRRRCSGAIVRLEVLHGDVLGELLSRLGTLGESRTA